MLLNTHLSRLLLLRNLSSLLLCSHLLHLRLLLSGYGLTLTSKGFHPCLLLLSGTLCCPLPALGFLLVMSVVAAASCTHDQTPMLRPEPEELGKPARLIFRLALDFSFFGVAAVVCAVAGAAVWVADAAYAPVC